MQAQGFGRARKKGPPVAGETAEAPDVDIPQVSARFTTRYPFGHQATGAATVGNTRGVEAGADKVIA